MSAKRRIEIDAEGQQEIASLREFLQLSGKFRPADKSLVVSEFTKVLELLECHVQKQKEYLSLNVSFTFLDDAVENSTLRDIITLKLDLHKRSTVNDLIQQLEKLQSYRPNETIISVENKRTGTLSTRFDSTLLISAGYQDGDALAVVCGKKDRKDVSENQLWTDIIQLQLTTLQPGNMQESLTAICHCILLENGFYCVVEQANVVAGFAPSLKGNRFEIQSILFDLNFFDDYH